MDQLRLLSLSLALQLRLAEESELPKKEEEGGVPELLWSCLLLRHKLVYPDGYRAVSPESLEA